MNTIFQHTKEYSVYPGEYIPLPETETMFEKLRHSNQIHFAEPPVNMDELDNCFKIAVAVPGVKREDILIYVHSNILSITIFHKEPAGNKKVLPLHEFDNEYMERHILLPQNVDTELIAGAYNDGLLHFYIPKTNTPSLAHTYPVVVY